VPFFVDAPRYGFTAPLGKRSPCGGGVSFIDAGTGGSDSGCGLAPVRSRGESWMVLVIGALLVRRRR
jgi:hypothetical protein